MSIVRLMYCPNCAEEVVPDAQSCEKCGALFGAGSAWSPVAQAKRVKKPPAAPFFSGQPKVVHAAQSIFLFIAVGPPVGLLLFALLSDPHGQLSLGFFVYALLLGAYAVGGAPAAIAGVIYCAAATILAVAMPTVRIGRGLGAAIGSAAGGAATVFLFGTRGADMACVGVLAGLIAGGISGWVLPVGAASTSAPGSAR